MKTACRQRGARGLGKKLRVIGLGARRGKDTDVERLSLYGKGQRFRKGRDIRGASTKKSSSVSEAAIFKLMLSIIDFYLIHLDISIFKSSINCTI